MIIHHRQWSTGSLTLPLETSLSVAMIIQTKVATQMQVMGAVSRSMRRTICFLKECGPKLQTTTVMMRYLSEQHVPFFELSPPSQEFNRVLSAYEEKRGSSGAGGLLDTCDALRFRLCNSISRRSLSLLTLCGDQANVVKDEDAGLQDAGIILVLYFYCRNNYL